MSYKDLLKDPRWQKRRLEAFEAANWRCEHCNRQDKELHVHHCYYIRGRKPWEYPDALLVVLCGPCHDEKHEHEARLFQALAMALRKVPGRRMAKVAQQVMGKAMDEL